MTHTKNTFFREQANVVETDDLKRALELEKSTTNPPKQKALSMKFSIETMNQITNLFVTDFENQLNQEEAKMESLEQELRLSLQKIGQRALGEILSVQDEKSYQRIEKCNCGGKLKRTERRTAKILSVFGWSSYRRGYYRCSNCGRRTALLDEKQGLKAGQASRGMAKLMTLAGISVSFSEASKQLKEYLLVSVSANTIRKETIAAGERQSEIEEEMKQRSQGEALQRRERELEVEQVPKQLYGSIDGAHAPLIEGWKEMKILSWYYTESKYASEQQRAVGMRYHSAIVQAEEFGQLLWGSSVEYLADKAKELIFVCDGAPWIWKLVEQYYPDAVQIVDWYHACQYLYPIADAVFDSQVQDKESWIMETKDLLWKGKVAEVLTACSEYQKYPSAQDAVDRAISYFTNNKHRMDYVRFRKAGYLIGSGTIESACKQIVSLRLKRAGARWSKRGAVATAKARGAWLSGNIHWLALFSTSIAPQST